MTKSEITAAAENSFSQLLKTCNAFDDMIFFQRSGNKWSVAENVQHLIISTNTSSLAFWLPAFLVKWIGGRPNRSSVSFDELKEKYYKKISEGAAATGRYVPAATDNKYGKQKLLHNWQKATTAWINALYKNRTEKELDNYQVKHPLLGRITLRELCYFTIFHTDHHLERIIKNNTTP